MNEKINTVKGNTEKYKVTGMSCAACSARVERAVGSLDGVSECTVNLLTGDMSVKGDCTRDAVVAAVISAGYGVAEENDGSPDELSAVQNVETDRLLTRLIASVGFVLLLMYFSMGHMIGLPSPLWLSGNPLLSGLCQMLLAGIVMVINQDFFISGFKGLWHRAPNMNTLVSIGSMASFGYSFAMLIAMSRDIIDGGDGAKYLHDLYFESAAMILALITVGKLLESRAKGKTTDAIASLARLGSKTVTLITDDGEEIISVDKLKVGDVFIVRPGESIGTDGTVLSGESSIDESMLTGESMPRDISAGAAVCGGTVNTYGVITVRADKIGEGTVLAGIIRTVKDAAASKAPIAKLADRISAVFVPSVMLISLVTFIGWMIARGDIGYAIARAVSVLVISCPCALGLATPVAIMVGSGIGAKNGILYKTAEALEECGRIKTVVLDKTGTLTEGRPHVTDVFTADGVSENELLTLAYSLEYSSEHPLSRAVIDYAKNVCEPVPVSDFRAISGKGVAAKLGEDALYALSISAAAELIGEDKLPTEMLGAITAEAKTPLVFIKNSDYIGTIAVKDVLKPDAVSSISALKALGIRTVMLSGDNSATVSSVARAVGVDEAHAELLPEDKSAKMAEYMADGVTAMVGDGINDAPALTRANVGIAIGRGTDIAIESADVVILGNDLSEILDAVKIGRKTLLSIKENLFWAFIYNIIGIPLAAGFFGISLSPMIGAAMMSLSSFSVVMNSLRINLYKPMRLANSAPTVSDENSSEDFNKKTAENENSPDRCELLSTEGVENGNTAQDKEREAMTYVIKVSGMMCPHCEARVKKACEEISGVISAAASHTEGTVTVEAIRDVTEECRSAITSAGYDVVD